MYVNKNHSMDSFRHVLQKSKPSGVKHGKRHKPTLTDQKILERAKIHRVIFPWQKAYQYWWDFTAAGALVTVFFEPYQMAFANPNDGSFPNFLEHVMTAMYAADLVLNFHVAYYDANEQLVFDRSAIARHYLCQGMFVIDFSNEKNYHQIKSST